MTLTIEPAVETAPVRLPEPEIAPQTDGQKNNQANKQS